MLILAHIAVAVSSIARSEAFYGRHFGFRRVKEYALASAGLRICILKKNAVALELFEFKKRRPLPAYRKKLASDLKTIGVKHFAFAVTDIQASYRDLKKARVRFETPMRVFSDGARYFFIKDPDGILIELMEVR